MRRVLVAVAGGVAIGIVMMYMPWWFAICFCWCLGGSAVAIFWVRRMKREERWREGLLRELQERERRTVGRSPRWIKEDDR